ncbi:MAG TPA: glutamate-cysteine ligase family protein [Myxococcales bacterium]|nr:glutamate-cysteine ligase family protein [Myxococcales bacterium]
MSLDLGAQSAAVTSIDDLVGYIRGAERPREKWLVGVEHEKIGIHQPGLKPLGYYGKGGIRELLDAIARRAGGAQHKHKENGQPIALLSDNASVTLEPGGQLELSGAPSRSFAAIEQEIREHLAAVNKESHDIAWLAAGYRPFGKREQVEWMPKGRYAAMKESLGPRGRLAPDMMLMTATVQANLDWSDEQDLAEKVRASTAISPIVTALFANSPLIEGKPSGYLDFRYQVWRETDNARCGLLEQMLKPDWGYRTYVDWAMDVPMLFIRNGKEYKDAQQQPFRDWFDTGVTRDGTKARPTLQNWVDHLTTLFPEVRVKRVLELRGTDVVPLPMMMSLPAIWAGILYDPAARRAAWELTQKWSFKELLDFQGEVAKHALTAKGPGGVTARDLAREVVAIARAGLKTTSFSEEKHLDPLSDIVESGRTLAERVLEAMNASGGDPQAAVRLWQIA